MLEKTERNTGIEALRIILMFMVCVLHVLGQGGVLAESEKIVNINFYFFWLIEAFCYCSVNAFAFITGYTSNGSGIKPKKIIYMWFQVFFYSFIFSLLISGILRQTMSIKNIIMCMLPITFDKYWYFSSYFILFLVAPLLNRCIFLMEESYLKKSLIVIMILLFVNLLFDPFKLNDGLSAMWLIVVYYIGVVVNKTKILEDVTNIALSLIWVFCVLVSWAVRVFFNNGLLLNYTSPTIVICGAVIVVLFSRLNFNYKWVIKMAPLSFGVYLFQLNEMVWDYLHNVFCYIAIEPLLSGTIKIVVYSTTIFVIGAIIELIRRIVYRILKMDIISDYIYKRIALSLSFVSKLLD